MPKKYAHVLIGMVTMGGRCRMENSKLKVETVAAHVAAMGSIRPGA